MRQQWVFLHRAIWFKAFIPVKRPRVLRCQPEGRKRMWQRGKLKGSGLRVEGTGKKKRGSVCWKYSKIWPILECSLTDIRASLCSAAQVSVTSALGPILIPSCIKYHDLLFLISTFLYAMYQKLSHSLKTNFSTSFYKICMFSHCPQRMLYEPLLGFLFISYLMWHNSNVLLSGQQKAQEWGNDLEMRKLWKGI